MRCSSTEPTVLSWRLLLEKKLVHILSATLPHFAISVSCEFREKWALGQKASQTCFVLCISCEHTQLLVNENTKHSVYESVFKWLEIVYICAKICKLITSVTNIWRFKLSVWYLRNGMWPSTLYQFRMSTS